MAKTFMLLFFFYPLLLVSQEVFHVLHIQGKIMVDSINLPLKVGDELIGNPKFRFTTTEDKAVLLSNLQGRLILFPNKENERTDSELLFYLKNNILPVKEYSATRGINNNKTFLYFRDNTLFIPKEIKVFRIPNDPKSFYFIEYSTVNETFTKKLQISEEGTFELNKDNLNFPSNLDIKDIKSFILKYYDDTIGSSYLLDSLNFELVSIENIQSEIKNYKGLLIENYKDSLVSKYLSEYIIELYDSELNINLLEIE